MLSTIYNVEGSTQCVLVLLHGQGVWTTGGRRTSCGHSVCNRLGRCKDRKPVRGPDESFTVSEHSPIAKCETSKKGPRKYREADEGKHAGFVVKERWYHGQHEHRSSGRRCSSSFSVTMSENWHDCGTCSVQSINIYLYFQPRMARNFSGMCSYGKLSNAARNLRKVVLSSAFVKTSAT